MTNRTVLVTRPEPGATATATRLREAGWLPVMAPFLAVRPMQISLPLPGTLQAVVAASGNAIALPDTFHALPLFAVGNATAARALKAGFDIVRSADGDASALAALACRLLDPERGPVLLVTGRGQGTALARALRQGGFAVLRRAVYASSHVGRFPQPAMDAIVGGLHSALFFSTETARAFARLLPGSLRPYLGKTDAAVIGPGAALALRHLPWRTLRVAVRPTQDEVLALL